MARTMLEVQPVSSLSMAVISLSRRGDFFQRQRSTSHSESDIFQAFSMALTPIHIICYGIRISGFRAGVKWECQDAKSSGRKPGASDCRQIP